MSFNVKEFLTEIGLPEEDQVAALALFGKHPDAAQKIEAKFSSAMSAAEALRVEVEANKARLDAEWETLAGIRSGDAEAVEKANKEIERLTTRAAALELRFRNTAASAGINADEALKDLGAAPVVERKVDTTMTFDEAALLKKTGAQAWTAFTQSALVEDIAAEHQELFGKPLRNRVELLSKYHDEVKRTGNPNLTVRDIWEKENNVQAKRGEIAEAGIQARITAAVEQAKREATDAAALRTLPPEVTRFEHSPVLAQLTPKSPEGTVVRTNGISEGVQAAIAGFRKLREGAAA